MYRVTQGRFDQMFLKSDKQFQKRRILKFGHSFPDGEVSSKYNLCVKHFFKEDNQINIAEKIDYKWFLG